MSHQQRIARSINHIGHANRGRVANVIEHAAVIDSAPVSLSRLGAGRRRRHGRVARTTARGLPSQSTIASVNIGRNIVEAIPITTNVMRDRTDPTARRCPVRRTTTDGHRTIQ